LEESKTETAVKVNGEMKPGQPVGKVIEL